METPRNRRVNDRSDHRTGQPSQRKARVEGSERLALIILDDGPQFVVVDETEIDREISRNHRMSKAQLPDDCSKPALTAVECIVTVAVAQLPSNAGF